MTYVYLWLIHVDIWQKTTKFYKAIILHLKNKMGDKKEPTLLAVWFGANLTSLSLRVLISSMEDSESFLFSGHCGK